MLKFPCFIPDITENEKDVYESKETMGNIREIENTFVKVSVKK